MPAPLPLNEGARLTALHNHHILDTAPEEAFDDLVRLAAHLCGVPIAAVSLLDEQRQWFKAVTGLSIQETDREVAFCAHTLCQSDVFVVPDAHADPRFVDNPLVTEDPCIRFYAGMPLVTDDGYALGSLCIMDQSPRTLTPEQEETLRLLARQVARHLQAARLVADQQKLLAERERLVADLAAERKFTHALLESLQEGIAACDAQGTLTLFNQATRDFHGLPEQPLPPELWSAHFDLYEADGFTPMRTQDIPLFRALQGDVVRDAEVVIAPKLGPARAFRVSGQAIYSAESEKLGAVVAMHDVSERLAMEKGLQESEARFRTAVEAMEEGLVLLNPEGTILLCNRSAERILGLCAAQIEGRTPLDTLWQTVREDGSHFPADQHPAMVALREGAAQRNVVLGVYQPGETLTWVSVNAVPLEEQGETKGQEAKSGVVVTFADITERKQHAEAWREADLQLRRSQGRLAEAQRLAHLGSWEYDIASSRIVWSEELFHLFGMDPAGGEPSVETLLSHYHPEDVPKHIHLTQQAMHDGLPYEFDIRILHPGGLVRWAHAIGRSERNAAGAVVRLFGTLMDIHERKEAEQKIEDYNVILDFQKTALEQANAQLEVLAATDGLTGLANQRAFQERLAAEISRAARHDTPLALVLLDVDHFKPYNDTFGHPAGDDVLRGIARILQESARASDIAARCGGEEFVLVLPMTDAPGAATIAERLRAAIEAAPWPHRAVTVSVGVCVLNMEMDDGGDLIASADRALYAAKAGGRNQVHLSGSQERLVLSV